MENIINYEYHIPDKPDAPLLDLKRKDTLLRKSVNKPDIKIEIDDLPWKTIEKEKVDKLYQMWLDGKGKCPYPSCAKQLNIKYKGEAQPSFTDFAPIRDHWYVHHMAPGYEMKFCCPLCSATLTRIYNLQTHIKKNHEATHLTEYIAEAKEMWYQKVGQEPAFNNSIFSGAHCKTLVTSGIDVTPQGQTQKTKSSVRNEPSSMAVSSYVTSEVTKQPATSNGTNSSKLQENTSATRTLQLLPTDRGTFPTISPKQRKAKAKRQSHTEGSKDDCHGLDTSLPSTPTFFDVPSVNKEPSATPSSLAFISNPIAGKNAAKNKTLATFSVKGSSNDKIAGKKSLKRKQSTNVPSSAADTSVNIESSLPKPGT